MRVFHYVLLLENEFVSYAFFFSYWWKGIKVDNAGVVLFWFPLFLCSPWKKVK